MPLPYPLLFVCLLVISCSQKERAKLVMGNVVEYTQEGRPLVKGSTTLMPEDTLSLILSSDQPFNVPVITFSISKLTNGQKQLLASEPVGAGQGIKYLRTRRTAADLIKKYGYGEFLVQFLKEGEVIAEGIYQVKPFQFEQ